ncbi:MAG: GAF domain-containing protein [Acidobacteriota bacterium]|jgi:GAF domain-containing protein|nr:GAF domain-containing protein [Acidobacteriota bacterium]
MNKNEAYNWALKQVRAQTKRHVDRVATLANTAAILKQRLPGFFWVGFYLLREDKLILGPFQGPPACMQLSLDKGVCAQAVKKGATVVVDDVDKFEGHVACDGRSRSEIVVPLSNLTDQLVAVLDVDSTELAHFGSEDVKGLEAIAAELSKIL